MKNAEKFRKIFKEFATEVWAFPEKDFLTWLNAEYEEPTTKNDLGVDYINKADFVKKLESETIGLQSWQKVLIYQVMDDCHSVTPQEPKTGHWYRQTNDFVDYYECSECGMAIGLYDVKNYCPNCGSRNEVEE